MTSTDRSPRPPGAARFEKLMQEVVGRALLPPRHPGQSERQNRLGAARPRAVPVATQRRVTVGRTGRLSARNSGDILRP